MLTVVATVSAAVAALAASPHGGAWALWSSSKRGLGSPWSIKPLARQCAGSSRPLSRLTILPTLPYSLAGQVGRVGRGLEGLRGLSLDTKGDAPAVVEESDRVPSRPIIGADLPQIGLRLREAGLGTLASIARAPIETLLRSLPELDQNQALALKRGAGLASAIVQNRVADVAGQLAAADRGYHMVGITTAETSVQEAVQAMSGPSPPCGSCGKCGSMISQAHYLVDVFDFVRDVFNQTIAQLDARFLQQWSNLSLSCGGSETRQRQVDLAVEVLERFVLGKEPGWDRPGMYAEMRSLDTAGDPQADPSVLPHMLDSYLIELGTTRQELSAAVAAGAAALAALAARLKVTAPQLQALNLPDDQIAIGMVASLPTILTQSATYGIDPNADPEAYEAAMQRANAAINRVQDRWIPVIRDNLVRLALLADPSDVGTVQALRDLLHIELANDGSITTTRIEQAVATVQSMVRAYRLGREPTLKATWDDQRWQWTRSYGTWSAAQMVFLYPENFALPALRRKATPQFQQFLDGIRSGATPASVKSAAAAYAEQMRQDFNRHAPAFTVALDGQAYLFKALDDGIYWGAMGLDGEFPGWQKLEDLPSDRLAGGVAFNGCIYLFFYPDSPETISEATELEYTWLDPSGASSGSLTKTPQLGRFWVRRGVPPVFTAGPARLSIYLRAANEPTMLMVASMEQHQWLAPATTLVPDSRVYQPSSMKAIGQVGDNDYLLIRDNLQLWLVRIDNPGAAYAAIGPWLALGPPAPRSTTFPDAYPCAGTVSGSSLVIVAQLTLGADAQVAQLSPPFSTVSFHSLGCNMENWESFQHDLVTLGSAFFLQSDVYFFGSPPVRSSPGYFGFAFDGTTVTALASGSLSLAGRQMLAPHPVPGRETDIQSFRSKQSELYALVQIGDFTRLVMDEWYFFIPHAIAAQLARDGYFQEAIDWLHTVFYPYEPDETKRPIWSGFNRPPAAVIDQQSTAWLEDPFDVHAICRSRKGAYLRHIAQAYVETLLDWADRLFAQDTIELTNEAQELYELALSLVGYGVDPPCTTELAELRRRVLRLYPPASAALLAVEFNRLGQLHDQAAVTKAIREAQNAIDKDGQFLQTLRTVRTAVIEAQGSDDLERDPQILGDLVDRARRNGDELARAEQAVLSEAGLSAWAAAIQFADRSLSSAQSSGWVPHPPSTGFCTPTNPRLDAYRFRAETNLQKIRSGRNVAGMKRQAQPYTEPVDPGSATQVDGSQLVPDAPPPGFRYAFLLSRARDLVRTAEQLEAAMLVADEKEAAEEYNLLKAKQDADLAQANVSLHDLRVHEASDSLQVAWLQEAKVVVQQSHFTNLLEAGLSEYEQDALSCLDLEAVAAGVLSVIPGYQTSIISAIGAAAQSASTQASYERRSEEWQYQLDLANQDLLITDEQWTVANDVLGIALAERSVSAMQSQFANDMVNFLTSKFTNAELYRWMAGTLRRIYQEELNLAFSYARAAQQALAFERQEPISIIGSEYWDSGRQGLLAAEQLSQDLDKLDDHRVATQERQLELTKVISLAATDPVEFQRLREEGVMDLTTLLDWFDRDFPGHYLRLIKQVSLTFAALVPRTEGIHASLSNTGVSRVVVGPPFEEAKVIVRKPEAISVTAADNGSGLFEVNLRDEMLLPFEGSGVETTWRLELPPGANRFDFSTLVDVQMTMRYTALADSGYRQKVLARLGADDQGRVGISSQTFFSAHYGFPDQWYHFQNPTFLDDPTGYGYGDGQTQPPFSLALGVSSPDLPPNQQVTATTRILVYVAGRPPGTVPAELGFTPEGTTTRYTTTFDLLNGRADASPAVLRSPSGDPLSSQIPPLGLWTIRLRNEADLASYPDFFKGAVIVKGQEQVAVDWASDMILLIQFQAQTRYPL